MLLSRTCFGADKEYCKMLVDAGYDAVDINDTSHKPEIFLQSTDQQFAFVKNVVDNILSVGLKIGQCHAPHSISLWCSTPDEVEQRIVAIENCVKTVSKLNIPYTVIHPFVFAFNKQDEDPEKLWQFNVDYIRRICKCATNTTICLENMPGEGGVIRTGDDMAKMLSDVGDDNLMVCLDTGHLISQNGKATDFFTAVGDRVKTLHIHDSIPGQDLHLLAGEGRFDWEDFKNALRQYNYHGNINSESNFVYKYPKDLQLEGQILERKILEKFLIK